MATIPTTTTTTTTTTMGSEKGAAAGDIEKGLETPDEADDLGGRRQLQFDSAASSFRQLGFLDRFLAVWIFLAMALGIILGYFVPSTSPALQKGKFVGVSVPIAVGLLVMMYPILIKVRYEVLPALLRQRELWLQVLFSVLVNWLLAPLLMLGLAWAFLPDRDALREGLILVGIARCIAMVLIWTDLAKGDGEYCALLVAFNSLLQIVLFAPLAVLFLRVFSPNSEVTVPIDYGTVAKSVGVFLGIPLGAAVVTRFALLFGVFRGDEAKWNRNFVRWISPFSLLGLLFTILVLFASQSKNVVGKITSVLRVAAPLLVYFVLIFGVALGLCRWLGRGKRQRWGYAVTVTQSLTAASNNFELAIAVAVVCYGAGSEQALAATVGPLVEVPVLLGLVEVVKWAGRRWDWE
ncbi:sodium bile acid symporter family-domain-containing protein [Geopyxis carbonaria]|nr:sodium bile acid symporter family-domain-containing protein [Geopyxis carbonaria]